LHCHSAESLQDIIQVYLSSSSFLLNIVRVRIGQEENHKPMDGLGQSMHLEKKGGTLTTHDKDSH